MGSITAGDYIALCMFALGFGGMVVREWRASITAKSREAVATAAISGIVTTLTAKMAEMQTEQRLLDEKRQKHELDCAGVQARTAAVQERLIDTMDQHGRAIVNLQSQMSRVATGDTGKLVEFGAVKPGN